MASTKGLITRDVSETVANASHISLVSKGDDDLAHHEAADLISRQDFVSQAFPSLFSSPAIDVDVLEDVEVCASSPVSHLSSFDQYADFRLRRFRV